MVLARRGAVILPPLVARLRGAPPETFADSLIRLADETRSRLRVARLSKSPAPQLHHVHFAIRNKAHCYDVSINVNSLHSAATVQHLKVDESVVTGYVAVSEALLAYKDDDAGHRL